LCRGGRALPWRFGATWQTANVRITFLGTASGTPTRTRNVAAAVLALDSGQHWLVDCGEGTQHQCMRASVRVSRIERILITHLHGDHCYGLPGLLSCLAIQGRKEGVEVVGPKGLAELVNTVIRLSDAALPFPLTITELEPGQTVRLNPASGWEVEAWPVVHRLPCFGFVLREQARPGRFHPERAIALGVPAGPAWGRLQQGEAVRLADGRLVEAREICDAPRKGRHVVLLGDTCDATAILAAARHCDLLVRETTYDATRHDKAMQWGHSTSEMTGRFAAEVGARTLIITHFSARFTDEGQEGEMRVDGLVAETAAWCPETRVLAAADLWSYTVPARE
jgi:ribonuclease Z